MQNWILITQKCLHLTEESQNKQLVNYVNGLLEQPDTKVSEETNITHCAWYNTEPASSLKFLARAPIVPAMKQSKLLLPELESKTWKQQTPPNYLVSDASKPNTNYFMLCTDRLLDA